VATKDKMPKVHKVKSADKSDKPKKKLFLPINAIGKYLKGSWMELKQVRWPNRRSTWGLTAAVLLFTGLFLVLIVSLDALFNQLFNLIIK